MINVEDLKIGSRVKLPSRRPATWNSDGGMDAYLGTEQIITSIDVRNNRFRFNGSDDWNFRINEIVSIIPNIMYTLNNVQGVIFHLSGMSTPKYLVDTNGVFTKPKDCSIVNGHSLQNIISNLNSGNWVAIGRVEEEGLKIIDEYEIH